MNATDVHTLFQQGQLDAAERAAHERLRQQPRDIECINVLALIALRRGQFEQAQALLESSLAIAPSHALTRHYLGRVHDAAGRADAAVAAHGAACRLAPRMFVIRLHYASALERAGQLEQAALQYFRAMQDAQAEGRWISAETTAPALRPVVEHAVQFVRATRRATLEHLLAPLRQQFGPDSLERVEHTLRIYFREEEPVYPDPRQKPTFLYMPRAAAGRVPRSLAVSLDRTAGSADRYDPPRAIAAVAGHIRARTSVYQRSD